MPQTLDWPKFWGSYPTCSRAAAPRDERTENGRPQALRPFLPITNVYRGRRLHCTYWGTRLFTGLKKLRKHGTLMKLVKLDPYFCTIEKDLRYYYSSTNRTEPKPLFCFNVSTTIFYGTKQRQAGVIVTNKTLQHFIPCGKSRSVLSRPRGRKEDACGIPVPHISC